MNSVESYRIARVTEMDEYLAAGWRLYGSPVLAEGILHQAVVRLEEGDNDEPTAMIVG